MRGTSSVLEPVLVVGAIAAAFLLGFSPLITPPAPIHTLSSDSSSYGIWMDPDAGTINTMPGMRLCVTGDSPITITGVHFKTNNGVQVTGFATRRARNARSLNPVPRARGLEANGFDPTSHQVSTNCAQGPPSGPTTELAIELVAPKAESYDLNELIVDYRDGERTGAETVYLHLGVCADPSQGSPC